MSVVNYPSDLLWYFQIVDFPLFGKLMKSLTKLSTSPSFFVSPDTRKVQGYSEDISHAENALVIFPSNVCKVMHVSDRHLDHRFDNEQSVYGFTLKSEFLKVLISDSTIVSEERATTMTTTDEQQEDHDMSVMMEESEDYEGHGSLDYQGIQNTLGGDTLSSRKQKKKRKTTAADTLMSLSTEEQNKLTVDVRFSERSMGVIEWTFHSQVATTREIIPRIFEGVPIPIADPSSRKNCFDPFRIDLGVRVFKSLIPPVASKGNAPIYDFVRFRYQNNPQRLFVECEGVLKSSKEFYIGSDVCRLNTNLHPDLYPATREIVLNSRIASKMSMILDFERTILMELVEQKGLRVSVLDPKTGSRYFSVFLSEMVID